MTVIRVYAPAQSQGIFTEEEFQEKFKDLDTSKFFVEQLNTEDWFRRLTENAK